ncbi:MAG: hypothetical protein U1E27_02070 [Kiritimatiellia bacterium]|nr:hypothetical protein [Kiritimatiellia bacterium]
MRTYVRVGLQALSIVIISLLQPVTAISDAIETRTSHIRVEDMELLLGRSSSSDSDNAADDQDKKGHNRHSLNFPFLLVGSPHQIRLAGISVFVIDGRVTYVDPSYHESAQHDARPSIMRTEIDPLDMQVNPVRYFESIIVVNGKDLPADSLRRSLYGQVLLLAYITIELGPSQRIRSLSAEASIVQAIVKGFGIPEAMVPLDEDRRVLPSTLWRLAVESLRARAVKSDALTEQRNEPSP